MTKPEVGRFNELARHVGNEMKISALTDIPYLREIFGKIAGVGFEPGRSEVKIKSDEDHHLTLSATPLHVENAIELRGSPIRALVIIQESGCRLLRLQAAQKNWSVPSREEAIFKKWDGLLRRLAQ